ncbi:peptidoglycan D,D-transpeptidase FtsI family protein [Kineococcus gynurae]|uniref:Peptidoglycan D,D-transpeptidase FtsI family protein n=1 Tax=Kineococcus gynurae TaxID=452979 RepID=A0ABV5LXR2_9ACTN
MSPSRTSRAVAGLRPERRLRAWVLVVLLVLSVFGFRLVQLQGADAADLAGRALEQRTRAVPLYAMRGDIVDDKGVLLATSVERRTVIASPAAIAGFNKRTDGSPRDKKLGVGPAGAAALIAPLLNVDVATLTAKLTGTGQYTVVAKDVTPEVWQQIDALDIGGIASERTTQRVYPAGASTSTLVGILGTPEQEQKAGTTIYHDVPLSGLEAAENSLLSGRDGLERYERSGGGQRIPLGESETQPAVDGDALHLTIDRDLQWKAQTAIEAQVEKSQAESGTVVVMDKHQRLLAMASAPSLDPTDTTSRNPLALQNTALTQAFEPGSTAKVVTLAAALEEGLVTPASPFTVPDEIDKVDRTFHDSHPHPVHQLTLAGILAQSSNVGTIMAGEKLSQQQLYDYQRRFGFGTSVGLGFEGETAGRVWPPDSKHYTETTYFTSMFGQGLTVNAVQAASVFATIANGGVRTSPSLIAGTSDPEGNYTASPTPSSERVVSTKTATELRQIMEAVVGEDGTAAAANIPGYKVAGKTGTAERVDPECGCYRGYTASFIGMAPSDDPDLIVAVILQDPKNGYYGGSTAGPVFKDVMTYALQERGVEPSTVPPADLPLFWGAQAGPTTSSEDAGTADGTTSTGAPTPASTPGGGTR